VDISVEGVGAISRDEVISDFNSHIAGWWQDTILAYYPVTALFLGIHWLDLDSAGGATGVLAPAGGHLNHGQGTSPFMPANVSFLIHKNSTARRGQRQGRMYIPQPREADVDDVSNVAPSTRTAITTTAETFRTDIGTYTYPSFIPNPAAMRIVHVHKTDPLDSTTWTWDSSTVDSMECDPLVATQRRRLR
jgi:hypothetical protein